MDASGMFLCTVVHPRLFPGLITDPGNPLRVTMLVEVGAKDLIIHASAASAKGKILGTEPLAKIDRVAVERLDGNAQRMRSCAAACCGWLFGGGIVLVFFLFLRDYPLGIGILAALVVAAFVGALNFLLNGGLGRKQDVVRFHFKLSEHSHTFYIEVPPTQELGMHQALRAAGLRFEDPRLISSKDV